jgi:hypothetical protein
MKNKSCNPGAQTKTIINSKDVLRLRKTIICVYYVSIKYPIRIDNLKIFLSKKKGQNIFNKKQYLG